MYLLLFSFMSAFSLKIKGNVKVASGDWNNNKEKGQPSFCAKAFNFLELSTHSTKRRYAKPPLARRTWPLTQPPPGPARNDTTLAMSSG
jgi:hypothetical protein